MSRSCSIRQITERSEVACEDVIKVVNNKDWSITRTNHAYAHSSLFKLHQISMSINIEQYHHPPYIIYLISIKFSEKW
jgi:hypothetical protein